MLAIHNEHDVVILWNWPIARVRIVTLDVQGPLVLFIALHARVVLRGNHLLSHWRDAAAADVGGLGPVLVELAVICRRLPKFDEVLAFAFAEVKSSPFAKL